MKLFKEMTQDEAQKFYDQIKTEKAKAIERQDRNLINFFNILCLNNLQQYYKVS